MEAHTLKENAARWLPRLASFPCLWGWWVVRLAVPLGNALSLFTLALAALVPAAAMVLLSLPAERYFLPRWAGWKTGLAAALSLLLGFYFDLSFDMLGMVLPLPGLRTLCHLGNGFILAAVILALIRSGEDLLYLGKVGWRQMGLLFLALNALTALYVLTSKTVYVWDTAGYWSVARTLAAQPLGLGQLREVLRTTLTLDYNHLLALPISWVMRLLGSSRAVFLFSISNLYTLPALWGLAALCREKKGGGLILAALFPMLVYTGLVGFVDTAACTLAIWSYVVYASDAPPESRGILSGALLVGSFLLRRYFFFFAASFGVAALVKKCLFQRKVWRDFIALFSACAVCALTFTYRFLLDKVLGSDYGDLYSAYDLGLRSDALLICRYFGWALLLLLAVLALRGLVTGVERPRLTFALVQMAVCFAAFVLVQSHGQQHLLLYLPALAAVAAVTLPTISGVPGAALSGLVLVCCLIPKAQPANIDQISSFAPLPSFTFYGPQREDIDQLLALADYVDSLSAEDPHTAVVLSSSLTLNSDTLINLRPSLGLPERENATLIQYHGTVDKRDAFNWNTPTADYLIIAEPVQVHLGEENQQVMALLARWVLEGGGPGAAYEALPETFTLQDGVTVRLYRRTRPWTYEEYASLSDALTERYPDYAQLYALPEWLTP